MSPWDDKLDWDLLWTEFWRILKPGGCVAIHCSVPFTFDLIMSQRQNLKYMWSWKKSTKTLFPKCHQQPLRQMEQICVFYKTQCKYFPQQYKGKPHMRGNPGKSQYYGNQFQKLGSSIHDTYYPTDAISFPMEELLDFLQEKDIKNFPFEEFANYLRARDHTLEFPTDLLEMKARGGRSFSRTEVMAEYFIKTYTEEGDVVLDFCCSDGTTGAACKSTGRKFLGFDRSPAHFRRALERFGLVEPYQKEE